LHPHAALPEASPKDHGEGRPETDTLTVSSRTTPRNKNTRKPARSASMTPNTTQALTLNVAEHDAAAAVRDGLRTEPEAETRDAMEQLLGTWNA
jgi:hypothetical protein